MLDKIKALCKARGMTVHDLEAAVGLGKNTVYRWNDCSPSVDKAKAVADYFGVTVDELLQGI